MEEVKFSEEDERKIRIFWDTYNAYYLDGFSQKQLNILKGQNPVYDKLIDNLYSKKRYAQFEYIEGPYSLHKFKLEADGKPKKSFYIFGEYHLKDSTGECVLDLFNEAIEFHEYLRRLSTDSPSFIDVYVELQMVKSKYNNSVSTRGLIPLAINFMLNNSSLTFEDALDYAENHYLNTGAKESYMLTKINKTFSNCLQPALRNVPECSLIRIHNIDIRDTWDNIPNDYGLNLLTEIIDESSSMEDVVELIRRINLETTLVSETLKILVKTRNLMDLLMMNKKLKDEIDLSYEKENITNFIQSKLNEFDLRTLSMTARSLIGSVRSGSVPTTFSIDELKQGFFESIENINVLKMDMYALARIFKPYDIYKDNPYGSFQPTESKNVIVYVGEFHARHYVQFFEYLATVGQRVALTYKYIAPYAFGCVKINKHREYYTDPFPSCGIQ